MLTRALAALLTTLSLAAQPVASKPEVQESIRLLETWSGSQMEYRNLPGLSVAVVAGDEIVWMRGFGFANVEKKSPVTPQTLFRMASNTKMFTALAILQLRDAGKISLDDPVEKYLPWFKPKSSFEYTPKINIRNLITHTSGLPRESASPYWTTFQFPTREEMIEWIATQEAAYPPDTRWKYSNLALSVAGEVVQAVSGEPYAKYIERHLLTPLKMTATSVVFPSSDVPKLATGYGRRMPDGSRIVMPLTDCKGITPAANLTSNAEDFAKFMIAMMKRGKDAEGGVLRGSTLSEMQRIHWLEPTWATGWGLGFSLRKLGERTIVGHGGSLAGYKTQTAFAPADKVGVVVLSNGDDTNPGRFVNRIYADLIPAVLKAMKPAEKKLEPKPEWSQYTGRYRTMWGDTDVLIMDGELKVVDAESDDPKASMQRLIPLADGVFKIEGPSGGTSVGEKARFLRDSNGKVTKLQMGWSISDRVAGGN